MQRSRITPSAACLILSALLAAIFFYGLLIEGQIYLLVPFYFVGALWGAARLRKRSETESGSFGHDLE